MAMENAIKKSELHTIDPNEKTICIVQMTRIGDLLQTLISAKNLKAAFPQMKLKLVARKSFARPITSILKTTFDEIFLLDTQQVIVNSLTTTLENLDNFLQDINATPTDLVVNLSFSKTSSYLANLINAQYKLGMYHNKQANQQIPDPWSQFVFSNVMATDLSPFSLVDIFNGILGVSNKQIAKATINKNSRTITIHPFASHHKKFWATNKWAEVIYKLLKNNPQLEINLIGSGKERAAAEELCNTPILKLFSSRLHNQVGQTSIPESLEIIKNSKLFIGHDSMAAHLAALAQRTAIILPLGTVHPHETAPYSAGNYILIPRSSCYPCNLDTKCEFKQCHADIPYQVVYSMAHNLFNNNDSLTKEIIEKENSVFHLTSLSIYRTYFNEHNFLKFENVLGQTLSTKEIIRTLYRITWLFYFANKEEKNPFLELTEETANDISKFLNTLQHLYELTEFGKKYSHYILSEISSETPQLQSIKEYSQKIDEIENLRKMLLKTSYLITPIVNFFTTARGNLQGTNIVELTEETYLSFHDEGLVISAIYDLSEKILTEYNIKHKKNTAPNISEV